MFEHLEAPCIRLIYPLDIQVRFSDARTRSRTREVGIYT